MIRLAINLQDTESALFGNVMDTFINSILHVPGEYRMPVFCDKIYDYCDDLSRKSKLLYNASLFRIRNIFTGYEKEHLTSNEAEVFGEVKLLHESYPDIHIQKVICYKHLEKLMRVTENPED